MFALSAQKTIALAYQALLVSINSFNNLINSLSQGSKTGFDQLENLFETIIDACGERIHAVLDARYVGLQTSDFAFQSQVISPQLSNISPQHADIALHALDLLAEESKIDLLVRHRWSAYHKSSTILAGSSSISLTRTRNSTASRPSTRR
jgi:hypothetical protein